MKKYFDEDGKEIDGLISQEELDAKLAEITKANTDAMATAKTEHDAKIAELNTKLEEAGLSDAQKKRLKEDKEAAEKLLEAVRAETGKKIAELETKFFGGHKTKLINAVAKDDETRQKITAKVETLMKTGDYANGEEGIAKAVKEATTIVMGVAPQPGFMDNISGAGDRGNPHHAATGEESPASKEQRKVFGISDEDVKKYPPKTA